MARSVYKSFLLWTRTLHIYATMLALILLIFFSFTGFVMNHSTWFNIDNADKDKPPVTVDREARIAETYFTDKGADHRLKMVEYLRAHENARGEMTSYEEEDPAETRVQFTGPGHKMEFSINKEEGKNDDGTAKAGTMHVHEEIANKLTLLGDLHKGTGTGEAWRRVIDCAAIFLMFASLSGLVLWISLPKRRTMGIVALAVSVVLCLGIYFWLIP